MPKRRAASPWLSPSTWQAWRTRAYSSTAFILTLPAVRTGRKIRRRLFTPPPRPDTPAASVRDFLSAAYTAAIDAILEADLAAPPKQRHTARQIWQRLRDEPYAAGAMVSVSLSAF